MPPSTRSPHQDTAVLIARSIDRCARDLNDLLPKIRALSSFLPSASDTEADLLQALDCLSSASSTLHRLS